MKGVNESTYQPLDKCIVCGSCGYDKDWSEEIKVIDSPEGQRR
jgi:hypothetical protein